MLKELLTLGNQAFEQLRQPAEQARHTSPQLKGNRPGEAAAAAVQLNANDAARTEDPGAGERALKRLPLGTMRASLGQDTAVIQHQIRQILAAQVPELATRNLALQISMDALGQFRVTADLPENQRQSVENVLNRHTELRGQFQRISQQAPTLEFLSNARKLRDAYGANNQALGTLLHQSSADPSLQGLTRQLQQMQHQHALPGHGQHSGFAVGVALN